MTRSVTHTGKRGRGRGKEREKETDRDREIDRDRDRETEIERERERGEISVTEIARGWLSGGGPAGDPPGVITIRALMPFVDALHIRSPIGRQPSPDPIGLAGAVRQ